MEWIEKFLVSVTIWTGYIIIDLILCRILSSLQYLTRKIIWVHHEMIRINKKIQLDQDPVKYITCQCCMKKGKFDWQPTTTEISRKEYLTKIRSYFLGKCWQDKKLADKKWGIFWHNDVINSSMQLGIPISQDILLKNYILRLKWINIPRHNTFTLCLYYTQFWSCGILCSKHGTV